MKKSILAQYCGRFSVQDVVWQKDIKSSTQYFLSQVTTTVDQQYLVTGSIIQATDKTALLSADSVK